MWLCAKTMVEGGYKRNLVGHIENSVDEYQLIEKWVDVLTWRNDAYANAHCWAVTKVIDASEPHWVNKGYVELTYEKAVCISSADYLCEILPDDWNSKGIAFLNSFIEYNISLVISSSSIQPCIAAPLTSAYSPETLYAATGTLNRLLVSDIKSKYVKAGLIITISTPSSMSVSTSLIASLGFVNGT